MLTVYYKKRYNNTRWYVAASPAEKDVLSSIMLGYIWVEDSSDVRICKFHTRKECLALAAKIRILSTTRDNPLRPGAWHVEEI